MSSITCANAALNAASLIEDRSSSSSAREKLGSCRGSGQASARLYSLTRRRRESPLMGDQVLVEVGREHPGIAIFSITCWFDGSASNAGPAHPSEEPRPLVCRGSRCAPPAPARAAWRSPRHRSRMAHLSSSPTWCRRRRAWPPCSRRSRRRPNPPPSPASLWSATSVPCTRPTDSHLVVGSDQSPKSRYSMCSRPPARQLQQPSADAWSEHCGYSGQNLACEAMY